MPQFLPSIAEIISNASMAFGEVIEVEERKSIPANGEYQMNKWYKIPDVICVFVDIRNSTQLSATHHDKSTASIYEFFTGTAVRILHSFDPSYIDIKGDGVFALFNQDEIFRAMAAAISFKTFSEQTFIPSVKAKVGDTVDIGSHMGIDQRTVLVKRVGIRNTKGTDERNNEVWAGKPINMAAKLASRSKDNQLWVSDRFHDNLSDNDLIMKSCGCNGGQTSNVKTDLWKSTDLSQDQTFDFDTAYILESFWCPIHGKEWCEKILQLHAA